MKKIVFLVLAFFLVFLSCTKDEKPVLTISQSSISAPSAGNSTTITLVANNPWSVSGTDWCTVSPSSGQGGGEITVTITVKENTTYDARNHTLTFISKELSQSLTVSQESNYGIVLPKNTYELSSDAQQISVEVKANVTYEVSIDADWIKENGTKALTSKTYTFDIAANSSYDSRDGVITIKEKDGNNVETIKVKQAQKDAIIISSKEYSLSSEAQTLEVKLQTNIDLEVVIPDDAKSWVSHTETKALSDKTLIFNIKANDGYDARNSDIIIKKKSTGIADTIRIAQAQKDAIIISKKDFELSSETHTIEVKLQTNVDISVSVSETAKNWISHTQTKSLTDKSLIIDIKANDTYGERAGEIYISSSKSILRDTIKIKQLQNDAIIISQKEYSLSSDAQTLEVKLQTNVNLEVIVPNNAKTWVNLTATKALSGKVFTFDIRENNTGFDRMCCIYFQNATDSVRDSIKIAQTVTQLDNQIWYTTIDNKVVELNDLHLGSAKIISNQYINGRGVITFDRPMTEIPDNFFNKSASLFLTVVLPKTLTRIGEGAFAGAKYLESIDIPKNVTTIYNFAFQDCTSLKSINFLGNPIEIGNSAFRNCTNLESFAIPNGISIISNGTFAYCTNLKTVSIPKSVTEIDAWAFENCSSLSSIRIPSSVESIEKGAFKDCTKLESFIIEVVVPPAIGLYTFDNIHSGCVLRVPGECINQYKNSQWNNYFSTIIGIE